MAAAARSVVFVIAALLAVWAGPASAHTAGIAFSFLPGHALQGTDAKITVSVKPSGTRCTLAIRYHGATQSSPLGTVIVLAGHGSWTWHVPTDVQAGPALATVHCAHAGSASRSLVIVGRVVGPKIDVTKQGFSVRPNAYGTGTRLSYGLVLHNASLQQTASTITVQVNFVLADDHLLGTDTQHVDAIPAGSDWAVGNTVSFPAAAPIARLEVVVQTGSFAVEPNPVPTLANIHTVPLTYDPNWVGTIEGELQNTDPVRTLRSAQFSAIVFDSGGNIVGGGTGFAFQTLPPGARLFLQLSGFDVIPVDKAATTMISVTPAWQPPGS